ncbi:hypothetical protein MUK42_19162 [Musa troglodytarum]|uniref:Uncharacterized protein n=1 Tax=Musa troglodytarum TaxID=320322 RepID=A0A9E7G4G5_9LILI|nr:hypothetical protein MUK42_33703 [Musa troglodytarum]URE08173.1 hypothetical protein MUK42_19162 [Musa troglodytarum]
MLSGLGSGDLRDDSSIFLASGPPWTGRGLGQRGVPCTSRRQGSVGAEVQEVKQRRGHLRWTRYTTGPMSYRLNDKLSEMDDELHRPQPTVNKRETIHRFAASSFSYLLFTP